MQKGINLSMKVILALKQTLGTIV